MRRRKKATNANECGGKIRYYLVQHISALVAIAQRKQIKKRYMHLPICTAKIRRKSRVIK